MTRASGRMATDLVLQERLKLVNRWALRDERGKLEQAVANLGKKRGPFHLVLGLEACPGRLHVPDEHMPESDLVVKSLFLRLDGQLAPPLPGDHTLPLASDRYSGMPTRGDGAADDCDQSNAEGATVYEPALGVRP